MRMCGSKACSAVANARKLIEDVRAGRANYDFFKVRAIEAATLPGCFVCVSKVCSGVVNARAGRGRAGRQGKLLLCRGESN